jgi:hypothetical protein
MLSKIDFPTIRRHFIQTDNINAPINEINDRLENYLKDSYRHNDNTYANLFHLMTNLDIKSIYSTINTLNETIKQLSSKQGSCSSKDDVDGYLTSQANSLVLSNLIAELTSLTTSIENKLNKCGAGNDR